MMDDLQNMINEHANEAPRVRPEDIEAAIFSEHYHTGFDGACGAAYNEANPDGGQRSFTWTAPQSLMLLTICILVLKNGFTVVGTSACASPENFNTKVGRAVARKDAERQVWPLLGFRLRDQLAAEQRELSLQDFTDFS